MAAKTFNLSLPEKLVHLVDKHAKKQFSNRSDYIRRALVNQLSLESTLEQVLNRANKKGRKLGIKSEQQVYDLIANKS